MLLAVLGAHAVRGDLGDRRRHEVDIGPAQRCRPAPVVAQRALGEGWEVRDHLLEQRVVLDLGPEAVQQHGPHEIVARAHRLGVLVPFGVDAGGHEQSLVQQPELPETVPAPVVRQQLQEMVELGRERVAVVRRRQQPGRGALVDVEMPDHAGQVRDELGRAGPGPDHPDPPPGQLHGVVPGRRMEGGPGEALQAGKSREGGAIELPDRADDPVECLGGLPRPGAVTGHHGQRPLPGGVVEAGFGHLAPEADALPQMQAFGGGLQVGQQIGLGRERETQSLDSANEKL